MKKYVYNFVDKVKEDSSKILGRRVFIIVESKTNKYVLVDGTVTLFFKSKDARNFIKECTSFGIPKAETWIVEKVRADLMRR